MNESKEQAIGLTVAVVVADPSGGSAFVDVSLPSARSVYGISSDPLPATSVVIRDTDGGPMAVDFHPAPRRQMAVIVTGRVAYTCTTGETREFGAGDIVIFDDTTGEGHSARVVASPRFQVLVAMNDNVDLMAFRISV